MNPYVKAALDFIHTAPDNQLALAFVLALVVLGMSFTLLILFFYCLPKHMIDLLMLPRSK